MGEDEEQAPPGHRLDCKLSLSGKFCTCDYHKRKFLMQNPTKQPKAKKKLLEIKQKQDGTTWMVSVIGPSQDNGSAWYSERAGKNAEEAALSYMKDPIDDNPGAMTIHDYPDETLIVVIDQAIAPSGKQWHVHLFCVENDKIMRFPG